MKYILLFALIVFTSTFSIAQSKKLIQKSWIKTDIENLTDNPTSPDTMYTRYSFEKSGLYISFYPAWDDFKLDWSLDNDNVKVGFDTYKIEALNDTALTIALNGFRRIKFLSEEYVSSMDTNLIPLTDYNGKPLYKANNYITPRYNKKTSLRNLIEKNTTGYNIKIAAYFLATFIVTEKGEVENVQIVKGITDGFDDAVKKSLLKTSKDWKPAYFKGQPIQTQMFYDIKYLKSLTR